MTDAAEDARGAGGAPALRLTLPGEWHALPLGADDDIAAEVAAFVRERFGRRDDHASQRAQQRSRLAASARRARDAGAVQFHLSLRGPGGVALATTVAEYRPRLPLRAAPGSAAHEPAVVADALVRVLAPGGSDIEGDAHWDRFTAAGGAVFDRGDGLVLRTARRSDPRPTERGDDIASAIVDYWLTRPGTAEVVLVTFTTALADLEPLITELFDAVIAAAEWMPQASASAGLRAELGATGRR